MSEKVLICAMNYLTCPFRVGSHHYAYGFKRLGYDVGMLSKPLTPWHVFFAKNRERSDRYEIWRRGGILQDGVWGYVPMSSFTPSHAPIMRGRWCMDHWYRFTCPNILNVLKERGFDRVKYLWFDNPAYGFLLDTLQYEKSVLRVADNLKGFAASWKHLVDREQEIARRADRVIYTAGNLKANFEGRVAPDKMTLVSNGVDFNYFDRADKPFPEEFAGIPEPRAVYVGAIDSWFDQDLVLTAARRLGRVNFVLIGLARTDVSRLGGHKNIFLLGPKPYERMPGFLAHSQLGIIPFLRNELVESVNPLKLYEYMACGLPVVCTSWEEVRRLNSPAVLADGADEFIAGVDGVLREPSDRQRYIDYARRNDWDSRLRTVMELLQ